MFPEHCLLCTHFNDLPQYNFLVVIGIKLKSINFEFCLSCSSSIQPELWMEGSVPSDKPASQELRSRSESLTTPSIQTLYSSGDLSMNDLKMCLNEFVSDEEVGISSGGLLNGNDSNCDLVMEDHCKDSAESCDNPPDSTSSAVSSSLTSMQYS